jgi:hypothetical protein
MDAWLLRPIAFAEASPVPGWRRVVKKAAKAGLAPLNGSNLTVGVPGYARIRRH